ncbi:hypothetical protein MPRF_09070 [Mycolicibacterium parafortuitum]|uniref:Uncharacterized protein n=1 Tax=Mycolicibacterium parafortuitum TaxID=39692 RepID=A0A7I7TXZ3_MYCPF|nr:hypothetical protein MPRF_09070 [Mycolicibacterium parafortuitum]
MHDAYRRADGADGAEHPAGDARVYAADQCVQHRETFGGDVAESMHIGWSHDRSEFSVNNCSLKG